MSIEPDAPYFLAGPYPEPTVLEVPEVATVVNVAADYPLERMREVFDATFGALLPVLAVHGLQPVGPAFSLHRRMPTETVDFEVGLPVDRPLEGPVGTDSGMVLRPSRLPGGRVAIVTHRGSYDGLGEAWARFMDAVASAGHRPVLPFWEVYVTEPSPEADPAAMRTDLVTLLA
ncbi:AraC family transcriptional regulator [Citricoccus sp. SGAir0253]|uniref:GyrI-like domain-containing protein n=1 Tax=Citricoccus sp. SGAir0253 TaxID=2567881 RepID=UPI0010CD1CE7|nr:GyrI-like domain-containing protein [Citricoccus sp. SGAir0253]QCU78271.1 AraC family transcriptional regulator [Citricoccus sp. SGAir0253]